jgi:hypothetical protein
MGIWRSADQDQVIDPTRRRVRSEELNFIIPNLITTRVDLVPRAPEGGTIDIDKIYGPTEPSGGMGKMIAD